MQFSPSGFWRARATASAGGLQRGELGRQSGDDDNFAVDVEALIGVRVGLVDDVAVAGEYQLPEASNGFERRRATATGRDRPVLGVFEIGGAQARSYRARRRPSGNAAAAAGRRRGEGAFASSGTLLGDQLERHEIWLQRAVGAGRAAAGLESPFGQMARD